MKKQKFYQLYKEGLVLADEYIADVYIEAWHNSDSDETLREFLGMSEMTDEDYSNFIVHGILK